jgi:hypothetical protein
MLARMGEPMAEAATLPSFAAADPDAARIRRRAIVSCAVGNFVELFDFLIFGLFAAQIGRTSSRRATPSSRFSRPSRPTESAS